MSDTLIVPEDTSLRQSRASDPRASAWVGANAGSGKTFVLTRRVVRLLLNGADPGRILCLTFTKAAAAQMATKVFETLARWTRLSDDDLRLVLNEIEGRRIDASTLTWARRLFARALETPGGLKIQTIHAFCEALLHQFPLEANVAGHFEVIDDRGQAELLAGAQADVLQRAAGSADARLAGALETVMSYASDMAFLQAAGDLVAKRDDLSRWVRANGSLDQAIDGLRIHFGIAEGDTAQAVLAEVPRSNNFSNNYFDELLPALDGSEQKSNHELVERICAVFDESDPARRAQAWRAVFYTQSDKPRSRFVTNAITEQFPDIADRFEKEIIRLDELQEKYRAIATIEATAAITRLAEAVIGRYESRKASLGLLDFDDLVVRTAELLSRSDAARWVQYKLDLGLDHVLIDEGQDTSPRQWQVIRQLVGEFFAGDAVRENVATIFAVGDEKQSIYSFQGAAPRLFGEMRGRFMAEAAAAERLFHDERLYLSFRSTPDVLGAVDKVFNEPQVHAGLSQPPEATVHQAARANDPGHVDIWPLIAAEPVAEPDDWRLPLDHDGPAEPARRLAERIADTISHWLQTGERLEGTGKRIVPGDILVLVRKRGSFVEALNRALKDRGVPAAGADRLVVSDHIAVQDLISFGRNVLLPADDLSLAEALKSPIIGVGEAELFELAHGRAMGASLSEALYARREEPEFAAAHDVLAAARARADLVAPYEFFAELLGSGDARSRFRARLGAEVDEVLDEFLSLALAYEQTATPSLEGFLAWLAVAPAEIKRQQDSVAREVRVMTVHGAKGLEAPVVFLVDSCSAPFHTNHKPKILPCAASKVPEDPPALVWTPNAALATGWNKSAVAEYRARQEEEYRRLLYVAMTRAADRLIVCGFRGQSEPRPDIWYQLVKTALEPDAESIENAAGEVTIWRWRSRKIPAKAAIKADISEAASPPMPAWLNQPVNPVPAERQVSPSRAAFELAGTGREDPQIVQEAVDEAAGTETPAMQRGRLVHLLLEHLPGLGGDEIEATAERILHHTAPSMSAAERKKIHDEVLDVLAEPSFASVFAENSRAEVAVTGTLNAADGSRLSVSGQIDRLIVTADTVLIVDYKTNWSVPKHIGDIPDSYILQLALYRQLLGALYPRHRLRAALLWTHGPNLIEIPSNILLQTAEDFLNRHGNQP